MLQSINYVHLAANLKQYSFSCDFVRFVLSSGHLATQKYFQAFQRSKLRAHTKLRLISQFKVQARIGPFAFLPSTLLCLCCLRLKRMVCEFGLSEIRTLGSDWHDQAGNYSLSNRCSW